MSAQGLKRAARRIMQMIGVEVRRIRPGDAKRFRWLQQRPIRTVLDIGANTGQFATEIHALLPNARIYSFEPLADSYRQLIAKMKAVPSFVAFNVALGDDNGRADMRRHAFT